MCHWHYRYAGLSVVSEIEIVDWARFASKDPFSACDVTISLVHSPTGAAGGGQSDGTPFQPRLSASEFAFWVPEIGHFRVRSGREIAIAPSVDVAEGQLLPFLLGPAWAALCYQRERLILHISAVEVEGGAIAFGGPSGAGKSSLAARLIERGFPLLSDDIACVDVMEDRAWIHCSTPRMKLWRNALHAMGWDSAGLERDHFRLEKFHMAPPPGDRSDGSESPAPTTLPLGGLFLLNWGPLSVARLTGLNAVRRLVAEATYRGYWLEPMGQVGGHWQRCAALAQRLSIYELIRPRAWSAIDEVVDRLLATVHRRPE